MPGVIIKAIIIFLVGSMPNEGLALLFNIAVGKEVPKVFTCPMSLSEWMDWPWLTGLQASRGAKVLAYLVHRMLGLRAG